jgi:hypothetical protein
MLPCRKLSEVVGSGAFHCSHCGFWFPLWSEESHPTEGWWNTIPRYHLGTESNLPFWSQKTRMIMLIMENITRMMLIL